MNEVESKLEKSVEMEDPKDLASCNRLLLDQQRLEDQLDNRRQELNDIKVSFVSKKNRLFFVEMIGMTVSSETHNVIEQVNRQYMCV